MDIDVESEHAFKISLIETKNVPELQKKDHKSKLDEMIRTNS